MITQERLKELITYDPISGRFFNKNGSEINSRTRIYLDGENHHLKRLAWLYVHGELPFKLKLVDGNRDNLKIENIVVTAKSGAIYYGKGIYYEGKYNKKNHIRLYRAWTAMLCRCFDSSKQKASYKNCLISDEFLDFQKFASWATTQIGSNQEEFQLDKDLLSSEEKIYSRSTCVFIPKKINMAITYGGRDKNSGLIGVVKIGNYYCAHVGTACKRKYISGFNSPESASEFYKFAKEERIRVLAMRYKDRIDQRAYLELMKFEVITEGEHP